MKCINCDSRDTMVLETRRMDDGRLRRRRSCPRCGAKFSTVETPVKFHGKRIADILFGPTQEGEV